MPPDLTRRQALRPLILISAGIALKPASLPALAATAPPSDFELPSVMDGRPAFKRSEAKGTFVALHFLLETECPFCQRHTQTLLDNAARLPGLRQIFIKPDSAEEIRHWARNLPKDAPLYRDADAALARAFGIPHGYQFHGRTVHYPALVILDGAGREVFRYVGKNNADRYDLEKLAAKWKELSGK